MTESVESLMLRTKVYHFTHIGNLTSVVRTGLEADSQVGQRLVREVGEPRIKQMRRSRVVDVGVGGVVGDYVPFYFAPRSPMLYSIWRRNVPSFADDSHDFVYLCSTLATLKTTGCEVVLSDRNAVYQYATLSHDPAVWFQDGFIDWELMKATMWNNTPQESDRMERRMAECLVHERVPWNAITDVGVYSDGHAVQVADIIEGHRHAPPVIVRPGWYF
jgi:hypothetical protein